MEDDKIRFLTSYLQSLSCDKPLKGFKRMPQLDSKGESIILSNENLSKKISEEWTKPERYSKDIQYIAFKSSNNDKISLPPVEVSYSESAGRFLIATRDINPGETVFWEPPYVLAPRVGSGPTCLECFLTLSKSNWPICDKCKCPRCKECCEGKTHSNKECSILSSAFQGKDIETDINRVKQLNVVLTPLRTFFAIIKNPTYEAVIKSLQSNATERINSFMGKFTEELIVPFTEEFIVPNLKTKDKLNTSSEFIHHICGAFDTNAFSVTLGDNRQARALLPLASLMNHSCMSNTQHWFLSGHIVVRASVLIRKGEAVTNSYTQTLFNTKSRINHLQFSKLFTCECLRCKDPTELGTHLSSVLCQNCKMGVCAPPLSESDFWICDKCKGKMSPSSVTNIVETASNIISRAEKMESEIIYKMLSKLTSMLGKQHSSIVKLHIIYIKKILEELKTAKDDDLLKALSSLEYLLSIMNILEPGITRRRGLLLLYKIKMITELAFRGKSLSKNSVHALQENPENNCYIEELEKDAEECEYILKWDSLLEDVLETRKRWVTIMKNSLNEE